MRTMLAIMLGLLLSAEAALADDAGTLADYVPADAVFSYQYEPSAVPEGVGGGLGGGVVQLADNLGLIPPSGRIMVNLATAAPIFSKYPHAVVVNRVAAHREDDGAVLLQSMQVAFVFWAPDGDEEIRQALQNILAGYLHRGVTNSKWRKAGRFRYQQLADKRLPGWLTIELGRVGDVYVVALGHGGFASIAALADRPAGSLASDAWYARQMDRVKGTAAMRVHSDWNALRAGLDRALPGRVDKMAAALESPGLERVAWALSFNGRKLYSRIFYRDDDTPAGVVDLSDPDGFTDEQVSAIVPDGATFYGAARMPVGVYYRRLAGAIAAAMPQRDLNKFQRRWREIAGDVKPETGQQLADNLGPAVWLHNWPVHPLRVPGMVTVVTEVRDDGSARKQAAALLGVLGLWLGNETEDSDLFQAQLRRDGAGPAWFLHVGIMGPAVRFTDGHMILSWSPAAARQNAAHLAGGE